jgi:hypothetical protein
VTGDTWAILLRIASVLIVSGWLRRGYDDCDAVNGSKAL